MVNQVIDQATPDAARTRGRHAAHAKKSRKGGSRRGSPAPGSSTAHQPAVFDPQRSIGYMPGLDGIRALAICSILFFHAGFAWFSGAYLSVDIFFVLSGFLITSLLLAEFHRGGTIGLRHFWANRARRLLPALLAMLAGVALYAVFLAPPDTLDQVRADALSTLFYGANWNQIAQGQGYFAGLASPTPLLHTWTLAIEEQFYLVWPLVVLGIMHWRRRLRPLLGITVAGAVGSALLMSWVFNGGAGSTRAYFGTDTRAQDLLIGAALAVVMAHLVWREGRDPDGKMHVELPATLRRQLGASRWGRVGPTAMVVAAGAGLAVLFWTFVALDQNSTLPYHGGFALVSVCTAVLIACVVVVPTSPWARLLSIRPVRYIGKISYGLYLWHWPVFLVLDGERTGLTGWPLFVVRIAVAIPIASLSFHLLEMPIRRGALRSWRGWVAAPTGVGATAVVLIAATAGATPPVSAAPQATTTHYRVGAVNPSHHAVDPGTSANVPVAPPAATGDVRVLMLGDSEASFLGFGLGPEGSRYHVSFADDGVIGCGLQQGKTTLQNVIEPDLYGIRGADTWVPCANQDVRWRADLDTFHPDVAMLSEGQFEVRDRLIDGRWTHLGEPLFDHHELAALNQAVSVLSSTGAHVVLLTAPYYDSGGEQFNGQPWPEDDPARVRTYNRLVEEVARAHPGTVSVADLNAHLDPSGHYQQYIGHVQVRYSDGIHTTVAGGRLLAPWLLTLGHRLGLANRQQQEAAAAQRSTTTTSVPG